MPEPAEASVITFDGITPMVAESAWIAPNATLIGDVSIAADASIWFGAVLRADGAPLRIGEKSNVQDGVVVHADNNTSVTIGRSVTVGHRAVLHGCTIDDDVLIGMGAVILNRSRIGSGSLVAAGSVVLEDTVVPPGSLVAGVPGKVRRALTDAESARVRNTAANYVKLAQTYATGDSASS